jgi:hypothetical protein
MTRRERGESSTGRFGTCVLSQNIWSVFVPPGANRKSDVGAEWGRFQGHVHVLVSPFSSCSPFPFPFPPDCHYILHTLNLLVN